MFGTEIDEILQDLQRQARLPQASLLVLGGSSSEIRGALIGQFSSEELGLELVARFLRFCQEEALDWAVQCCEHLNRALVMERQVALRRSYRVVTAVPALHAGGSLALAAYRFASDPVLVEAVQAEAGLDIGETDIGMHVRAVQVPLRLVHRQLGQARVNALMSRPPKIGGERAQYVLQAEHMTWQDFLKEREKA